MDDRYFNTPNGRASLRLCGDSPSPLAFLNARSVTGEIRWGIDWSPNLPVALQIHLLHAALDDVDATG
jgi:hypothetical protein